MTRGIGEVVPPDLLMQLLIAAGYFESFSGIVSFAPAIMMNRQSFAMVIGPSALVVLVMFFMGGGMIFYAVRKVMKHNVHPIPIVAGAVFTNLVRLLLFSVLKARRPLNCSDTSTTVLSHQQRTLTPSALTLNFSSLSRKISYNVFSLSKHINDNNF